MYVAGSSRPAQRLRAAASRGVLRAALVAQRVPWRPPRPLRRLLAGEAERAAARLVAGESAPAGWDRPLLGDGAGLAALADTSAAAPPEAASAFSAATAEANLLRCALVTSHLDVGGMDEMVAFLARRLPRHGVAVRVLHCPDEKTRRVGIRGRLAHALAAEGVEVLEHDEAGLKAWLDRWRPDVLSVHGAPGWALRGAAARGLPVVETLHGMHALLGEAPEVTAARGRLLAAVVGVSELVSEGYRRADPAFDPRRVHTVPNGVRLDPRDGLSRAAARAALGLDDEPLVVSLARHSQQKNSYALVDAFDEVAARFPTAHLVVAGRPDDASYTAQLLALRDRLPIGDRVHVRDHCAQAGALLAAADVFVLDSFFEGWSLASMEALAVGVPVVLSDVGGAREQVGPDGTGGLVVPNPLGDPMAVTWESMRIAKFSKQGNREALVQALCQVLGNRAEWLAGRADLAVRSRAMFDADRCVEAHARVLRSVVRDDALAPSGEAK
jgi:glycosyltransferase involved in cell wall biosynthesis